MWQRRFDYLPTRETFLTLKLTTSPNYMDWLSHNGKLYLLPDEERSRQHRCRRPKQGPINTRSGKHAARGSTSALAPHKDSIGIQPP
ncbi:hypothetical protein Gohar_027839, partial [Gossypium harknessii]|nr:hypothetical protein [Gossypium harknessii]